MHILADLFFDREIKWRDFALWLTIHLIEKWTAIRENFQNTCARWYLITIIRLENDLTQSQYKYGNISGYK